MMRRIGIIALAIAYSTDLAFAKKKTRNERHREGGRWVLEEDCDYYREEANLSPHWGYTLDKDGKSVAWDSKYSYSSRSKCEEHCCDLGRKCGGYGVEEDGTCWLKPKFSTPLRLTSSCDDFDGGECCLGCTGYAEDFQMYVRETTRKWKFIEDHDHDHDDDDEEEEDDRRKEESEEEKDERRNKKRKEEEDEEEEDEEEEDDRRNKNREERREKEKDEDDEDEDDDKGERREKEKDDEDEDEDEEEDEDDD